MSGFRGKIAMFYDVLCRGCIIVNRPHVSDLSFFEAVWSAVNLLSAAMILFFLFFLQEAMDSRMNHIRDSPT